MKLLAGGCALIPWRDLEYRREGARLFGIAISKEMGARDILQTISLYDSGRASSRRNPFGEEVLYVVRGFGACQIDEFAYSLRPGTAVYIPPGSVYQIQNTQEEPLEIVGVVCPEDRFVQADLPLPKLSRSTPPKRTVLENAQTSIRMSERTFKVLVDREQGCNNVTQFVGIIPPGRAPMHRHSYEEAIYILEGEGRMLTDEGDGEFSSGASIYLPRYASHSLENTGTANVRLLGVFHPAGSPADRYEN